MRAPREPLAGFGRDGVELEQKLPPSRLINDDIAPSGLDARTWSTWNIAALWVGMSVCIPTYMLGVVVTSATLILFGEAIWNPVDLVARLTSGGLAGDESRPLLGFLAMFAIVIATLSTNIAANVVAPANSFSNLAPQWISLRMGGLIAGLIGILIFPWKLLDAYQTWLITYSGPLGAVGGVIVCDYVFVRRAVLDLVGLYSEDGPYVYVNGINMRAVVALVAGVMVALLGLLHPSLGFLFNGAWFSAAIVSFVLYYLLMKPER